jgi:hypothetical protein
VNMKIQLNLTEDEIIDKIDGFYAYDNGATDSGIKDDSLKEKIRMYLNSSDEATRILTKCVRHYCEDPYTIEDVKLFMDWLKYEGMIDWL